MGRCFRTSDGRYAIVANVPQECETKTGVDFNPYQFPAIWLSNALIPFDRDMVFYEIQEKGESELLLTKYEEITPEEFLTAFEEHIQRFRSTVEQTDRQQRKTRRRTRRGLTIAPSKPNIPKIQILMMTGGIYHVECRNGARNRDKRLH